LPPALQDFERILPSRSEDEHQRALGRLGIHNMLLQAIAMLGNGEELDVSSESSSQCSFHNKYKRLDLFVYLTSPAWHFSGHEGRPMLYLTLGLPKQGVANLKAAFRTEAKDGQFGKDTAKSETPVKAVVLNELNGLLQVGHAHTHTRARARALTHTTISGTERLDS
jgi:hypothetical protein